MNKCNERKRDEEKTNAGASARWETGASTSRAARRTGFPLEIATGQLEIPLTTSLLAGRRFYDLADRPTDPDKTRDRRAASRCAESGRA